MFDRLLDQLTLAPRWEESRLPQSADITAGLLSAMAQLMRSAGSRPAALRHLRPVPYVYDGTVYALSVRGTHDVGPADYGRRHFDRTTRMDFSSANGRTREPTRFSATFPAGAPSRIRPWR
jgi:hypothetical protein